jgi:hypothetical protein
MAFIIYIFCEIFIENYILKIDCIGLCSINQRFVRFIL